MPVPIRVAAALQAFIALGFGVPCVICIRSLAAGDGIPRLMGFPAYGEGPFEKRGIETSIPLVTAFLVVCVLELIAAYGLWTGARSSAIASLALLPVGAVFWWGFALPLPPLFAILWTTLFAFNWDALR